MKRSGALLLIIFVLACGAVYAQSSAITFQGKLTDATSTQPTAFTYQGKLTDGGVSANGTYDFQFTLYDAGSMNLGSAVGSLTVANGIFTASIDGASALFTSSNPPRFLEIGVRLSGGGSYTTLTPRQPISSSPFSMKALSAASADSFTGVLGASQGGTGIGPTFPVADTFLRSTGMGWTVSGILPTDIPSGSTNYLQNLSVGQQSGSFNVTGNGGANIFNAGTQFNIGGNRVLSVAGANNLFAGVGAGAVNTLGSHNAFFGLNAGAANTTGFENSFFGSRAGVANTTGIDNSFFGQASGESNTTGRDNSFFGRNGNGNTTGSNNTLIGNYANVGSGALNYATAIGSGAIVAASDTVVLGRNLDTVQVPGNLNVAGTFTGNINGSGITNLNATNITSGTLNNARLGVIPIANGGTGSPTKNFVDLTTFQNIGGDKNFTGNLSGNIVNAATQFRLGDQRVLSESGFSLFVGTGSGFSNTAGFNTFVGSSAGYNSTDGDYNAFFGAFAGQNNTGNFPFMASFNSFFGFNAGNANTGRSNSFFGKGAGETNTTGAGNSIFGAEAGPTNTTGSLNTIIGQEADVASGNLVNATAIGSNALVSQSNSVVLGSISGQNGATSSANVGIGTSAPTSKLYVLDQLNTGLRVETGTSGGSVASFGGLGSFSVDAPFIPGGRLNIKENGNVGIGTSAPNAKLQVAGGSIYIQSPNSLIITSPNGACWFITVNNAGALSTISVACP